MKKQLSLFLSLLLILSLLTACGSSKSTSADYYAPEEVGMTESVSLYSGSYDTATGETASSSAPLPESRKFIITVALNTETDDLDAALTTLNEKIAALGGYIESQQLHNGSARSARRYRSSDLTVRIPVDQLDAFTRTVDEATNVVSSNRSLEDVTLTYVDTETRLASLRVEQERLLQWMEEAGTLEELLEIESRLTDVNYELEKYGARLRLLDNQIDYATVSLTISEVKEYTPVEEPTFGQRIVTGFTDSVEAVKESVLNFIVLVIVLLPFLVVWGLLILVVVLIVKCIRRKLPQRKKKAKKQPSMPWSVPAQDTPMQEDSN